MESKPFAPEWAPPVRPHLVKKLYESDAAGLRDDALLDEVGFALFFRCETIHRATKRLCPTCGERVMGAYNGDDRNRLISCADCGWSATWREYHRSYKGRRIHGGGAYPAFFQFYQDFPKCRTAQAKMLTIDNLIHAVHRAGAPGIANLIRCKRTKAVKFLDEIAYGDVVEVERRKVRDNYRQAMQGCRQG